MRREDCACGGAVFVDDIDAACLRAKVHDAVREHIQSLTHRIWRYAKEGPNPMYEVSHGPRR